MAVNHGDAEPVIQKYVSDNKFTFKIVMGGDAPDYAVGKAYGVQAYPTNYLVGPNGKILWRGVGFNEAAIRKALADAGIK